MSEPNWLDPEAARAHKIVLVGLDEVPEGEHRFTYPFRPDDFDGLWRSVCSCGQVFGPAPDASDVQWTLFCDARAHAYVATTGRRPPREVR